MIVEYQNPSPRIARDVMRARLALLDTRQVDWDEAVGAVEGLSHADITRACENAAKDAILANRLSIDTGALVRALKDRGHVDEA